MTRFSQVTAALRRKSLGQYALLTLCCFVSVLLITAYASMMGSPTVLSVFPEGGDSRKQMTMIFVLAVLGCGVFTTYASGLFFRHKSRDVGILLALGASKDQLRRVLAGELALMSLSACALGALLGTPLAWFIWQGFRLLLVDSEEMALAFDPHAYLLALAFSLFVVVMLFVMLGRFLRRTNILDVVNESRKSESIRAVPRWYGPLGIILLAAGGFLGYMAPKFFILVLHWYAPDALTALFYLPALAGLYMILLHTVVNGWRRGSSRYRDLITSSMMKFQGRQTVRNMVVVTVLAAGAYFAAFYIPMLSSGTSSTTEDREFDYLFHYRADQDMPGREEVLHLAEEMGVTVTRYAQQAGAVLAYDGYADVVSEGPLGATYDVVYCEETASDVFLSESAWNILTGDDLDLEPGTAATVYDRNGDSSGAGNSISLVTNHLTGEQLAVTPAEPLRSTSLLGYRVLDDGDYARITQGLPDEWREVVAVFDVEDEEDTYFFARALFDEIVDRSGPEVALFDGWDPVVRDRYLAEKGYYFLDPAHLEPNGFSPIEYDQRDSSNFRNSWKYMPRFRVLDQADFTTTMAVFLMLFVFVSIVCFAAMVVILFTRCMTIAMTNARVYDDLRHLGASSAFLRRTVKGQISRVFFVPLCTGTLLIYAFFAMILYFNSGSFTPGELAGLANCALVVLVLSLFLYGMYRFTLGRVCSALSIRSSSRPR
ncbi:ABC transporter permease [Lawsonibacter asaccharolyticus]